jgi:hypothetical protein
VNWKADNFLGAHPPGEKSRHMPVDLAVHAVFAAPIVNLAHEQR